MPRSLPDLDLARIAHMERDQKRRALTQMKLGRPPYTYNPMRRNILDILNVAAGPLVTLPRTPWAAIENDIRRGRSSADEISANLRVAEGLYTFATDYNLNGQRQNFMAFPMGMSEKVVYWSQVVVEIGGRSVVPFFDPRRTKKLTVEGRRFVFSVMNERIRVDPDFSGVRFAIIQFHNSDMGARAAIPHFDDGVELWGFDDLDAMVRETYEIWQEVLREREDDARRKTGTRGDLI